MAYKSIKKEKRKGGKKYNRRTYKQNGGYPILLMLSIALSLLVSLRMIVPVSAEFYKEYVNKEENKKKIEQFENIFKRITIDSGSSGWGYLLALSSVGGPIFGTVAKGALALAVADDQITTNSSDQRKSAGRTLDILRAEANADYLYISKKEMEKLLPNGFKNTPIGYGKIDKYTKINTEKSSLSNWYDPKSIQTPIKFENFNAVGTSSKYWKFEGDYYAVPYKEYFELVKRNKEFAEIVKDLTAAIESDIANREELKHHIAVREEHN